MNNTDENVYNPLLDVVRQTFEKSTVSDLATHYLKSTEMLGKWSCYSDYCFDDPNKPNDVVCFTFIPYIDDFVKLSEFIKSAANVDIKKTRKVRDEFIHFLTHYPLINFSFILQDRAKILTANGDTTQTFLLHTFSFIKQQYTTWGKNQPEQKAYYATMIKKLDCVIRSIKDNKKIKQITDMVLVTFLGAYVASRIVSRDNIEIFGWFSDRDAINEVCEHCSIELFQYYLHGLCDAQPFKFVASRAGSMDKPFYEEMVRIPDYIAGTIADFNMTTNSSSKSKFDTMLNNYMAENIHNNFVYRMSVTQDNNLSCARIKVHKV